VGDQQLIVPDGGLPGLAAAVGHGELGNGAGFDPGRHPVALLADQVRPSEGRDPTAVSAPLWVSGTSDAKTERLVRGMKARR
jgi:hypothetical protein